MGSLIAPEEIADKSRLLLTLLLSLPSISVDADAVTDKMTKRLGTWKVENKRGAEIFAVLIDASPESHRKAFQFVRHHMDRVGRCRHLLDCVARWHVYDPEVAGRRLISLLSYMNENNLAVPQDEFDYVRALILVAPTRAPELLPMLNRIKGE